MTRDRMRYRARPRLAAIMVDGRPMVQTATGALRPLIEDEALHDNPGFEDDTAGVPDDWNDAFGSGGTFGVDASDFVSGSQSAQVDTAAGGSNFQVILSGPFDVAPGDLVDVGAWSRKETGDPTITIGLLSRASGTPTFIDPPDVMRNQLTERLTLTDDWAPYSKQFLIPAGHERAAMWLGFDPSAAEATSSRVDLTTSKRTGTGLGDSADDEVLAFAAPFDGGAVTLRKIGGVVFARGGVSRSSGSSTSYTTCVDAVPLGFRPPADLALVGQTVFNTSVTFQFQVTAAGALQVRMSGATALSLPINASWAVA